MLDTNLATAGRVTLFFCDSCPHPNRAASSGFVTKHLSLAPPAFNQEPRSVSRSSPWLPQAILTPDTEGCGPLPTAGPSSGQLDMGGGATKPGTCQTLTRYRWVTGGGGGGGGGVEKGGGEGGVVCWGSGGPPPPPVQPPRRSSLITSNDVIYHYS